MQPICIFFWLGYLTRIRIAFALASLLGASPFFLNAVYYPLHTIIFFDFLDNGFDNADNSLDKVDKVLDYDDFLLGRFAFFLFAV